ncbi:cytochrome P450 [Mycobacterium sp. 2YAF39]
MYQGQPAWVVSRYQDIRAALVDPRLSAKTVPVDVMSSIADGDEPVMFARTDDPEHHRIRQMMARNFTFRRSEAMRPKIQKLVDRHLDRMIDKGSPADLFGNFALPVPSLVISLLLGVPPEDLELFQHHTAMTMDSQATADEQTQAFVSMFIYILDLVDRKLHQPGDDLISRLATDYIATGELSRETAAISGVIMMQAGHETTASMIALGTIALMQHRDVFEQLGQTDDRAIVANIVEELMRYLAIVHAQVDRIAIEDLTIAGELIRAGDMLVMNLPAGNWDPAFVPDPETFDIGRSTRGHLGFGYGVHQCIGQNLARVEMQTAFATLARRLPGLRLAVPIEELRFHNESGIYGINELPVTW